MAVKEGMIGMSYTNARPSIAPTFGVQPMLGTNPIAFGAPTDENCPFLFDAATSIIQRGKIEVNARKNIPVPDGLVIDSNGSYANDPVQILKGLGNDSNALLPLGGSGEDYAGYKGYDLATMVEILSSCLQSGSYLLQLTGFNSEGSLQPFKIGHYFQALNIESFVELDAFKKSIGGLLRSLRNSTKARGQNRIYTAGEKEFESEIRTTKEGITILPSLQKELLDLRNECGLSNFVFRFS
jgi:LDH2 family malate/lactate/ureidoglycolate dehydrogenase